ncbi:MAG: carbohydrate kinase family protein [Hydrogenibacillus sp.]|nr:carbohydrate kinase family protein [Hydrogenibacillus sp.]
MITVIGDAVVDIIVRHGEIQPATDTPSTVIVRAGGQGNNVAAWAAREGAAAQLIARIGHDVFGDFLVEEAERQGIAGHWIRDPSAETGKIVILVEPKRGERTMFVDRGAGARLHPDDLPSLSSSSLLYVSAYALLGASSRRAVLLAREAAFARNLPLAVDPSSLTLIKTDRAPLIDFAQGATFLFPNYDEGAALTGARDPEAIVRELARFVRIPVLKLGQDGCLLYVDGQMHHVQGHAIREVVDTTGAGDAFVGTFLAAYVKTRDVLHAAARAVTVAGGVVMQPGARPPLSRANRDT